MFLKSFSELTSRFQRGGCPSGPRRLGKNHGFTHFKNFLTEIHILP
jgi:hypothetical protein